MEFSAFPNEYNGQDNTISSKILDIMRIALEINPPTIDSIGKKKTAVFVWWFPHCPELEVTIYKGGWKEDMDYTVKYVVYPHIDGAAEKLDEIIKRLYEIREEQND